MFTSEFTCVQDAQSAWEFDLKERFKMGGQRINVKQIDMDQAHAIERCLGETSLVAESASDATSPLASWDDTQFVYHPDVYAKMCPKTKFAPCGNLFVGGIDPKLNDENSLGEIFQPFGDIVLLKRYNQCWFLHYFLETSAIKAFFHLVPQLKAKHPNLTIDFAKNKAQCDLLISHIRPPLTTELLKKWLLDHSSFREFFCLPQAGQALVRYDSSSHCEMVHNKLRAIPLHLLADHLSHSKGSDKFLTVNFACNRHLYEFMARIRELQLPKVDAGISETDPLHPLATRTIFIKHPSFASFSRETFMTAFADAGIVIDVYRQVEDGTLSIYIEFLRLGDAANVVEAGLWTVADISVKPCFAPHVPTNCLWLERIPPDVHPDIVTRAMRGAGPGTAARRPIIRKDVALVYFESIASAKRLFSCWDRMLHKRKILMDFASQLSQDEFHSQEKSSQHQGGIVETSQDSDKTSQPKALKELSVFSQESCRYLMITKRGEPITEAEAKMEAEKHGGEVLGVNIKEDDRQSAYVEYPDISSVVHAMKHIQRKDFSVGFAASCPTNSVWMEVSFQSEQDAILRQHLQKHGQMTLFRLDSIRHRAFVTYAKQESADDLYSQLKAYCSIPSISGKVQVDYASAKCLAAFQEDLEKTQEERKKLQEAYTKRHSYTSSQPTMESGVLPSRSLLAIGFPSWAVEADVRPLFNRYGYLVSLWQAEEGWGLEYDNLCSAAHAIKVHGTVCCMFGAHKISIVYRESIGDGSCAWLEGAGKQEAQVKLYAGQYGPVERILVDGQTNRALVFYENSSVGKDAIRKMRQASNEQVQVDVAGKKIQTIFTFGVIKKREQLKGKGQSSVVSDKQEEDMLITVDASCAPNLTVLCLADEISEKTLKMVFEQHGKIKSVVLHRRQEEMSSAEIVYEDASSVMKAYREMNAHFLGPCKISIKFRSVPSKYVWLGGVPSSVQEQSLRAKLSLYGTIVFSVMSKEKGFAIFGFDNEEAAKKVSLDMSGRSLSKFKLQTCLVTESFALRTKEALEKSNARHSRHDADAETPKETKDQKRIAELFQRKKEEQARKKGKRRSASRERGKRDDRRRSEKSRKSPEPPRKAKEPEVKHIKVEPVKSVEKRDEKVKSESKEKKTEKKVESKVKVKNEVKQEKRKSEDADTDSSSARKSRHSGAPSADKKKPLVKAKPAEKVVKGKSLRGKKMVFKEEESSSSEEEAPKRRGRKRITPAEDPPAAKKRAGRSKVVTPKEVESSDDDDEIPEPILSPRGRKKARHSSVPPLQAKKRHRLFVPSNFTKLFVISPQMQPRVLIQRLTQERISYWTQHTSRKVAAPVSVTDTPTPPTALGLSLEGYSISLEEFIDAGSTDEQEQTEGSEPASNGSAKATKTSAAKKTPSSQQSPADLDSLMAMTFDPPETGVSEGTLDGAQLTSIIDTLYSSDEDESSLKKDKEIAQLSTQQTTD
ncbi:hypothetical protein CAPTEDRAFT_218883 [Capitella teleta]|uniref:RRM domain-containing protein n=1 Tax=Capitella teleta TaxID=283909 RepID=R7UVZ9_CAPTE|nr:hypothetical protein CAPTEDRAFT_218883 [Capitella teleta]|eukprot:ELU08102.1 hypothetical protein CAPTEDRAFT_218883 [Capitella teleta]